MCSKGVDAYSTHQHFSIHANSLFMHSTYLFPTLKKKTNKQHSNPNLIKFLKLFTLPELCPNGGQPFILHQPPLPHKEAVLARKRQAVSRTTWRTELKQSIQLALSQRATCSELTVMGSFRTCQITHSCSGGVVREPGYVQQSLHGGSSPVGSKFVKEACFPCSKEGRQTIVKEVTTYKYWARHSEVFYRSSIFGGREKLGWAYRVSTSYSTGIMYVQHYIRYFLGQSRHFSISNVEFMGFSLQI